MSDLHILCQEAGLRQQVSQLLTAAGLRCVTEGPPAPGAVLLLDETHAAQHRRPDGPPALLLQTSRDARRTLQALREGYGAVLLWPDDAALLVSSVQGLLKGRAGGRASAAPPACRVIPVWSAAGGSGRTTVAAHLAAALAAAGIRTLALDLNHRSAALRQIFADEGTRSLVDLLPVLDELSDAHLRNAVAGLWANLDLLGAPSGGTAAALSETEAAQLIDGCARSYGAVVIDLPAGADATVAAVLGRATDVLYLLNPDPPGAWALTAAMAQWEHWEIPRERLQVILNHRNPSLIRLEPDPSGKLFGLPIRERIPFDASTAFCEVRKVWNRPQSLAGLAGDVRRIAALLQAEGTPDAAPAGGRARTGGWLSGLLRRSAAAKEGS